MHELFLEVCELQVRAAPTVFLLPQYTLIEYILFIHPIIVPCTISSVSRIIEMFVAFGIGLIVILLVNVYNQLHMGRLQKIIYPHFIGPPGAFSIFSYPLLVAKNFLLLPRFYPF